MALALNEAEFLAQLRSMAHHPGARGLADDAAVLGDLVLTHDMLVEGVHFLPTDPPGDVAWKLLAVNLSDLAAKGATPIGVLMGYALTGDTAWDRAFLAGLEEALTQFEVPLLGGDTVKTSRVLGLTAIGRASPAGTPSRSGARPGDGIYVTGTIGDAGAGLEIARREARDADEEALLAAYRRPQPRLAEGAMLAGRVSAIMDISDGLLLDAQRLAEAGNVALEIDLDRIPLSHAFSRFSGDDRAVRLHAAVAGDDYELLFTAASTDIAATRIGYVAKGTGISLQDSAGAVELPARLGWLHG